MPSNIKGITVEIGGNTAPLQKALEGVNKKSRDLQGELKQVERLLKLDPGNTELIAQKQKLLADSVGNTKEKLDSLKTAQAQVNAQFSKGKISAEQYRAFQREIIKTEQELEDLEEQLKKSGNKFEEFSKKAKDASEKIKDVGEKIKGVGEKMTVGITAPVVAAGAAIIKSAVDSQKAQGRLQASLGLTKDAAEDLQTVANAVWANGFGENIDEVDAAIAIVRKNIGKLAGDEMQKVTEGAMTIAGVFDQDVSEVTAAAGVMMKNFGIDAATAFDIITVGFQQGGDFSGELLDTLKEYSPQFKSLGLTADQAMATLLKGAQAGAFNLDKVGDSMKEFNLRAQDGSKTTADGFKAIGLDANKMGTAIAEGGEDASKAFMATITALSNMKDPVAQNTAGVALFGSQWEDVRSKVIVAMKDGKKGLSDFSGATDKACQAINDSDPGSALQGSFRQLQLSLVPLLQPISDIIINSVIPAIKSLIDWFNGLSPSTQQTIVKIAGVTAIIGPAIIIIGSMVTAISGLVSSFGLLIPVIGKAVISMGTHTAALIVDKAETIALMAMYAKDFIVSIGQAIVRWGINTAAVIANTVAMIANKIAVIAGTIAVGAWNVVCGIATAATWAFSVAIAFLTSPIGLIVIAIAALIAIVVIMAMTIYKNWDAIKAKATELWQGLVTAFTGIKDAVVGKWNEIVEGVKSVWSNVTSFLYGLPGEMLEFGGNIIQGLINGIKNKIAAVKDAIVNVTSAITDKVKNILGIASPSKVMIEFGQYTGEGLALGIGNTVNAVKKATAGLAEGVKVTMAGSIPGGENKKVEKTYTQNGTDTKGTNQPVYLVLQDERLLAEVVAKNQKYVDRYNNRAVGGVSKW